MKAVYLPATFILLVVGLILIILLSLNAKLSQLERPKSKEAYIPIVLDQDNVILIHGVDTIYMNFEGAYKLQDEYIIYVTQ